MSEPGQVPPIVVVIDDDYVIRLSCEKTLEKVGYRVETFSDGAGGIEGIRELRPDLIVVDLKMPGISGMDVINRVHEIDSNIVIVVITGYATISTAIQAMQSGAYDFLPKPFSPDELRLIVQRGLERRRLILGAQRLELERELLKRRFVTFVAHQLQTPLVAIEQYLDVMKHLGGSQEVEAMRDEWLDRCLERTREVVHLTKSWLSLARVDSGCLTGEPTTVDLKPIVASLLNAYEKSAESARVSLEADIPGEDCQVQGDRTCCVVLVENLIVNAIKYNKPGGRVLVALIPATREIEISVKDTGVGIPRNEQDRLFTEFYRITEVPNRKTDGSGLGLAICKRILSEMGGRVEVESEPNVGSTFRLWLPRVRPEPAEGHFAEGGNDQ